MRYTIAKEQEVKKLAAEGRSAEYITTVTGIPAKVIWTWCPQLRPHEDVIKQSVKQRYHFLYPDLEAKITTAFSPFICKDITDDEWEDLNKLIYDILFEESLYVFKNVLSDPPTFSDTKKLSNFKFLEFLKKYWTVGSEYLPEDLSESYIQMNYNSIHYWSFLKSKMMKDVTKGDMDIMLEKLSGKGLSTSRINSIMKTALIPLKYAYKNGLTLLRTYDYQLPKIEHREKIDDKVLYKILNMKWDNFEAYLANLIACQCRLQQQEVRALRLQNIYTDGYIEITHCYGKKGLVPALHPRIIEVSSTLIDLILKYVSTSPFKEYLPEDYVLYSIDRDKPANTEHCKQWTVELKKMCSQFMSDVSQIDFSIWN